MCMPGRAPCFSPVSGVDELGTQAEPLQRLVADDNEDGRRQGGDDPSGETLGQAPHALLSHELLKRCSHRRTAFHLEEGGKKKTMF